MENNSKLYNRRTMRISGYEYTQAGTYFITVVTKARECLFGDITNGSLVRNDLAVIIQEEWDRTAIIRPGLRLDAFIVMPNHVHGMITILEDGGGSTLNTIEARSGESGGMGRGESGGMSRGSGGMSRGESGGLSRGESGGLSRGESGGMSRGESGGMCRGKADGMCRGKADGMCRGESS